MSECKYNIENIEGILQFKDIELIDFKIANWELIYAKDLSGGNHYPWEMHTMGLTYGAFNEFFNDRVVRNNTQDIRMYLDFLKLEHYDFNKMILKMNGWDALGLIWVKFKNIGAQNWNEILTQKYPIF